MIVRNSFSTFVYNVHISLSWLQRRRYTLWLWRIISRLCEKMGSGIVSTTIHGKVVDVPFGYPYPIIARMIQTFNCPLIELVYQRYQMNKAPISLIDGGASIGDTVFLLIANCPGMISRVYCVEGEIGFFRLLKHNLREYSNVMTYSAMLSSNNGTGKGLVRIHPGTASAIGARTIPTMSLDTLVKSSGIGAVDILKIDVDGYDGKVLRGQRSCFASIGRK